MVILAPISQLGCFKACFGVALPSSSLVLPKKGPPEQVSRIFSTESSASPTKHWKMAECSESIGAKVELLGGIILFGIGAKILIEHLG